MKKLVLSLVSLLCTAQFSMAQWWNLTGNSGTTPGTNYIGTQDPKDMVFKTSNTEWMRLTKDGLFGIGLVTPKAKIDMLMPTTYLTTQESGIRITYPSVATTEPIINTSIFEVRSTILGSYSSKFIVKDNGNVGIGMLVPDARFHVKDYNGVKLDAHIEGFTLLDGYEASLLLGRQTGAAYGEWGIEYNNHVSGLNFWRPAGSTAPHGPNSGNYHLFIKNDGRVSIGIDATVASNYPAGYRLYVAEGILTEKVKVALINTSDWADMYLKRGTICCR